MQQELHSHSEERSDPAAVHTTPAPVETASQALTQGDWWARETIRSQEARLQRRRASLERKLRAAEGNRRFGKWACFATGVVWSFALPVLMTPAIHQLNSTGANLTIGGLLMLQPVWAFVYLVGNLRRSLVQYAARRQGLELSPQFPVLRRWLVMSEDGPLAANTALFVAPRPGDAPTYSAGTQLDASLARDRRERQQREQSMQRRLDAACRLEQRGRNGCLWSAYCTFFFCIAVALAPGVSTLFGIGTMIGLVLSTLMVGWGKVRQRLLVSRARVQALDVVRVNDSATRAHSELR